MNPMRLIVKMPHFGTFSLRGKYSSGEVETPVETMVSALRRVSYQGAIEPAYCRGLAWIPEAYRKYIGQRNKLVDGEYAWVYIHLADNRKSLTPFFESGDKEWPLTPSTVPVSTISGAQLEALAIKHGGAWLVEAQRQAMESVLRLFVVGVAGSEVEAV